MFNTINSSKPRAFVRKSRDKTVSRSEWSKEVDTFLDVFGAVMRQTRAPRCSQIKYLYYLKKQLLCRRTGFLAQCRNYPVFGLRLLGGDVDCERTTEKMFKNVRLRHNADNIALPTFLSWYWNRLWQLRLVDKPSKSQATEISRILAVLSFAKFLKVDCKRARKRAEADYSARVKANLGSCPNTYLIPMNDPLYLDMVDYLKSYGNKSPGEFFGFDRRCYSLKCLVGKKPHRPYVPPVYSNSRPFLNIDPLDYNGRLKPNLLHNVVNRWYYDREEFDGKLCVISESGGKYRGICPYTSPYTHSTSLYGKARGILLRSRGNCNYDQRSGHSVAQSLSLNYKTKISADASNFTDTIDGKHWVCMARALGADASVEFHNNLRIKDFDGKVFKGSTPLMGWKGTFDLASVILNYATERALGRAGSRERVSCGDDLLGYGKLEDYIRSYESIGCKLSVEKTIVSKTVTIFCGEMFFKGHKVTPCRFLTYGLSLKNKYVGEMISRIRSFIQTNNYTPKCRRVVYRYLMNHLGERYRGYLDFRLSSDLGGIPLLLGKPEPLLSYLNKNKKAYLCALCNIPIEPEDFVGHSTHFSHLPLGKPYNLSIGMKPPLTPGSWPTKRRLAYGRRKKFIIKLLDSDRNTLDNYH
jgi:hypothetical protein